MTKKQRAIGVIHLGSWQVQTNTSRTDMISFLILLFSSLTLRYRNTYRSTVFFVSALFNIYRVSNLSALEQTAHSRSHSSGSRHWPPSPDLVLVRDTPFLSICLPSPFNSAVAMNAVLNYWPRPTTQSLLESTPDSLSWWPFPGQYSYPKYAKRLPSTTPF